MKKTEFAKMCGISGPTLAKLSKNETVSMETLIRICRKLDCKFDDVLDILPENESRKS